MLAGVAGAAERFEDFRLILQRNIFNLHRTPQTRESSYVRPTYRPVTGDYLALVGTLAYQTNQLAFFDGTSPEYRKAVRPSENVAGYRLLSVHANSVRLENAGQIVELRVGTRLSRADGQVMPMESPVAAPPVSTNIVAAPRVSTNVEVAVSAPASTPASESGAAPATDPGEILRRLMQKREQELQ